MGFGAGAVTRFLQPQVSSLQPSSAMSYRTVKRALGETNLERKCLLLFGTCLLVLISGSFWWYGTATDRIVYDYLNRFVGKALVNSAMLDSHKGLLATSLEGQKTTPDDQKANESLAELLRNSQFNWDTLYPDNPTNTKRPKEEHEQAWMKEW